jgi:hypothetical protein
LQGNQQPPFRDESTGLIDLLCASISPNVLGRREAFKPETEDVDFNFIALSYMETPCRHYQGSPACDPSYSQLPQRAALAEARSAAGCML